MSNGAGSTGAHRHARGHTAAAGSSAVVIGPSPAGFESLYIHERSKITNLFQAFVLPLHWSLVRGGLRLRLNDDVAPTSASISANEITELLPSNWTSRIGTRVEDGVDQSTNVLLLRYWDPQDSTVHYEAKVIEVVKNSVFVAIVFRAVNGYGADGTLQAANRRDIDSNSPGRNSAAGNFMLTDYFTNFSFTVLGGQGGGAGVDSKAWFELYKNLESFETVVWTHLLEPVGLSVRGKTREPGPYDSKASPQNQQGSQQSEQQSQQQQQQQQQQPIYLPMPQPQAGPYPMGGIGGPLFVPPGLPAGGGGLGRSDMDPLGGFGGGMVADPRGFRQPAGIPFGGGNGGGVVAPPPGARFDPFGPPMPNPPRPTAPGGGAGGNNFGNPNPDAEQPPPGFEDMFM